MTKKLSTCQINNLVSIFTVFGVTIVLYFLKIHAQFLIITFTLLIAVSVPTLFAAYNT